LEQFVRVTSLVDPAIRLLRPAMMWRAASAHYRQGRRSKSELDELDGRADLVERAVI
jgi:uncharacterized protein YjiS (DUF1127 family)